MNTLTVDEVRAIVQEAHERYPESARTSVRVELHALLQLKNPPPYSDRPAHLSKEVAEARALTRAESDEVAEFQRAQVTDAEHIAFSKARGKHGYLLDGHHYVQWEHGKKLWAEADRILATVYGDAS